jgi:hypothetical protein
MSDLPNTPYPQEDDEQAPNDLLDATGSFVEQLATDTLELPTREFFYAQLGRHSPYGVDGQKFDPELRQMYGITEVPNPTGGEPLFLLPHLIPQESMIVQTSISFGLGNTPPRPYSINLIKLAIAVSLIQPSTNQFMREARREMKRTGHSAEIGEFISEQKQLAARLTDRLDILDLVKLFTEMKQLKNENNGEDSITEMSFKIRSSLLRDVGEIDATTFLQGNEARLLKPF